MKRRLAVLTEIIAPYRVPVFNALATMQGIDLHVIFLAETDSTMRQWRVPREEIAFSYEVLPSWRWRVAQYNVLLERGLWTSLKKFKPEIIVCGGYNYLASWKALWWARRHRVPFVLWSESTANDQRELYSVVEFLKTRFLGCCDGFAVAGTAQSKYLADLGFAEKAFFVVPDAVDNAFFARASSVARGEQNHHRKRLDLPPRFFLYVGRLVPEKGVFDLLAAYSNLQSDLRLEIGLVFVGDGSVKDSLLARAAEIRPGSVKWAGFAQREELAIYYGLAETFVFPTHSDPWGLVVNEAMACGLPVIVSTAAGCAADLVTDGWNGYVVPTHNVARMTSAMDSLARSSQLRRQMAHNSEERIQQHAPELCAAGLERTSGLCNMAPS
jgi:glycosyltransferase involved in cell wall biosynthesis